MKNLLFLFCLKLIPFMAISGLPFIKYFENSHLSTTNEISVEAWVQFRGEWIQGYLFINNGQVTRCQFPNLGSYSGVNINAQIYQPTLPVKLNPNNPMAINNSFTHYIDIPNYGRAYFILQEQRQNQYQFENSSDGMYPQVEKTVKAYVQIQGQWVDGLLFISNGMVSRCQFPNLMGIIGRDIRAQIYQPINPTRLNPNHQQAVTNNFTHFIDIPNYGRAYFTN
jgi:hypothetical protein